MATIFQKQHGMNIVGQGGIIILFMLPSLVAAIWVDVSGFDFAGLPDSVSFLQYIGYVLLGVGIVFWATAIVQLLTGFPKGTLITTGAYGIVRNPIYSSATFFILPGVACITLAWVYLVPAVFLYVGVALFIRKEERQLTEAFGTQYQEYLTQVHRLLPFKKP